MDAEEGGLDIDPAHGMRVAQGVPDEIDINSQRGGPAEIDAIQPQADVLSPTGSRMDDELPQTQKDLARSGNPTRGSDET